MGSNPISSGNLKMFLYLKLLSKDKQTLKKFTDFLIKLEILILNLKCFSKQKKRKFITVLKSPHVNKTAQEQYEFRFYSKEFVINSFNPLIILYFLKKIKTISFTGIRLEIKILFLPRNKIKSFLKSTNPDHVTINTVKKKSLKYIKLFDCYGEIFLKHFYFLNFR